MNQCFGKSFQSKLPCKNVSSSKLFQSGVQKPADCPFACWKLISDVADLLRITTGRAGLFYIYTYCMYTIKLKALILSIVFNCLFPNDENRLYKVFFFFFYSLLVHVCRQNRWKKTFYGWYTHTHVTNCRSSCRCKKKRRIRSRCLWWMHKLNICNSAFWLPHLCTQSSLLLLFSKKDYIKDTLQNTEQWRPGR